MENTLHASAGLSGFNELYSNDYTHIGECSDRLKKECHCAMIREPHVGMNHVPAVVKFGEEDMEEAKQKSVADEPAACVQQKVRVCMCSIPLTNLTRCKSLQPHRLCAHPSSRGNRWRRNLCMISRMTMKPIFTPPMNTVLSGNVTLDSVAIGCLVLNPRCSPTNNSSLRATARRMI